MNHQQAEPQLPAYKDVLHKHLKADEERSHSVSREGSPSALRFSTSEEDSSFPYAYMHYVRLIKGNIIIKYTSAKVTVQGKNLRELYMQIERYKTDAVALSPSTIADNGQPIVDAITITYDEDEKP